MIYCRANANQTRSWSLPFQLLPGTTWHPLAERMSQASTNSLPMPRVRPRILAMLTTGVAETRRTWVPLSGSPSNRGWIASFWGTSENNRKAKYYRLTPEGRKQLASQKSRWEQVVRAISRIMSPVPEEIK
jgi:hypothetical protein